MEAHDDDTLLTPSEVAAMFRVNPKTVTRWARAGKISAIRTLGGHRRFRASEIRQFLEQVEEHQDLLVRSAARPPFRTEGTMGRAGRVRALAGEGAPPSSGGLGRRPFKAVTGIRTPLGAGSTGNHR